MGQKQKTVGYYNRWVGNLCTFMALDTGAKSIPTFGVGNSGVYHDTSIIDSLAAMSTDRIVLSSDGIRQ